MFLEYTNDLNKHFIVILWWNDEKDYKWWKFHRFNKVYRFVFLWSTRFQTFHAYVSINNIHRIKFAVHQVDRYNLGDKQYQECCHTSRFLFNAKIEPPDVQLLRNVFALTSPGHCFNFKTWPTKKKKQI